MIIYGLNQETHSFDYANMTKEEQELVMSIGTQYIIRHSMPEYDEHNNYHFLNLNMLVPYVYNGEQEVKQ